VNGGWWIYDNGADSGCPMIMGYDCVSAVPDLLTFLSLSLLLVVWFCDLTGDIKRTVGVLFCCFAGLGLFCLISVSLSLSICLSINAIAAAAATTTCHPPSRYQSARAKALPTTIGTRRLRRHSRLPQGPRRLTTTITTSHLRRTASRTVAGVVRVAMVLPRLRRRHHCHQALLHRPVQVACVAESL